jgi:signal transduction histidine kinase
MPRRNGEPSLSPSSPIRVFGQVLLLVFSVEGTIMLCFPWLPDAWRSPILASLLDASTLTLIVAPAVWLLSVLPLRRLFEARGRLLERLFESQEQERAAVARDLHDSVGQQLTALMVGLRTVEDAGDLETARARAHDLRKYASLAHSEARRLARGLRPTILEELGLASAIERLCEDFEGSHGWAVVLQRDAASAGRLDPATETALYRIAQEALTNVSRHAGASEVEVGLARDDDGVTLSIHDDGCGFDTEAAATLVRREGGFGLGSIRERTLLLGGALEVRTSPGHGTTLTVRIPVRG